MTNVSTTSGSQTDSVQQKGLDEHFCHSCGQIIKIKAEICPKCGVRQKPQRNVNKAALLLITFFLGGIGGHKFYLSKYWQGAFYLLFFWTGIPGIISLIEFIIYIFTSSESLQEKYTSSGAGVVIAAIAGAFFFISIIGILAAIAIPQFVAYKNKAAESAVVSELQSFVAAEHAFFSKHQKFATSLRDLNFVPATSDISIEIISTDQNCFQAQGIHIQLPAPVQANCNGVQRD